MQESQVLSNQLKVNYSIKLKLLSKLVILLKVKNLFHCYCSEVCCWSQPSTHQPINKVGHPCFSLGHIYLLVCGELPSCPHACGQFSFHY
jgi:hypothetical protein